jgi:glycosyltransferase involved in cell wall biosynthesis
MVQVLRPAPTDPSQRRNILPSTHAGSLEALGVTRPEAVDLREINSPATCQCNTENMKFLIVSSFYPPHLGGVEAYVKNSAHALKALGNEVDVLTCRLNTDDEVVFKDSLSVTRVKVLPLLKERFPIPYELLKIEGICKKIEPDVLIINTRFYLLSVLSLVLGGKYASRIFFIEHGTGHVSIGNRAVDALFHVYEHLVTSIIRSYKTEFYGVSQACTKWLRHFRIQAKGVLYNGVNPVSRSAIRHNRSNHILRLVFGGRVIKEKGIVVLLNAVRRMLQEHRPIELFVAGDGGLCHELKREYFHPNIHFLGAISHADFVSLLGQSDVLVVPSMYPEGLPTALLEAGMMHCAVIATARGGTEEVIIHERTGIIIKENDEDAIISAIGEVLSDGEHLKEIQEGLNHTVVTKFTWGLLTKNFVESLDNERAEV